MTKKAKRALLSLIANGLIVVALYGAVCVTFAGIDAYMVLSGRAMPGEPIFLDQLASPLDESLAAIGIGVLILCAATAVHLYLGRGTRRG
jgi:hypothetical protein